MSEWISATEASTLLGITTASLYAYVSRGQIRSAPSPGASRSRNYSREDVERLVRRNEERRNPEKATARVLHFGLPLLESGIALITPHRLYYRGHDVADLSRTRSIEEVASLVWTGRFDADVADTELHVVAGGRSVDDLPFITRAQAMLPLVAVRDVLAWDLRPHAVAQTGWRILNLLTSIAVESADLEETIDATLARAWAGGRSSSRDLIRAALILCADHELNVSSFTARCVASAGSSPYSAVLAGLAAIEGTKHGGISARVERVTAELRRSRDLPRSLAERLRNGESIDGFRHRLYAGGDPRAILIMDMLAERFPKSKELAFFQRIATEAEKLLHEKPNLDFALVALARTLRLPEGAPLTIFALGRTIGWIGHVIEQYAQDSIIRPRARYTGPAPIEPE